MLRVQRADRDKNVIMVNNVYMKRAKMIATSPNKPYLALCLGTLPKSASLTREEETCQ